MAIVLIAGIYLIVCDAACFYQLAAKSEEPVKGELKFFHIVKLIAEQRLQLHLNSKSYMQSLQPPQPTG